MNNVIDKIISRNQSTNAISEQLWHSVVLGKYLNDNEASIVKVDCSYQHDSTVLSYKVTVCNIFGKHKQ